MNRADGRTVRFVRWPAEAGLRNYCKQERIPRILVVEGGVHPPVCTDLNEDWVRAPISRQDIEARVRALRQRSNARRTPVLDASGVLHFDSRSITISSTQAELLDQFVSHYRNVVYRSELEQRLTSHIRSTTRNSLDLHIMRIRRRIAPVDLRIRTVRGRGYLLEPMSRNSDVDAQV